MRALLGVLFFSISLVTLVAEPQSQNGFLDFRNWEPSSHSKIDLQGDWEFYPWEFLNYGEFPEKPNHFHPVPLIWNNRLPGKENADGIGYGTLRLRFENLPKEELMLYLISIPTSHSIYCGPEKITSAGRVSKNLSDSIPNLGTSLGSLPKSCYEYKEFIWHISNFHEFKGGPWYAPMLGSPHAILTEFANHFLQDVFFLGVTAIMSVYHFVLWMFRRQDKRSLVFSLTCFLFLIRILGTGKMAEFYYPELPLYELMNKLEYFGFIGLLIVFPWLCYHLFPLDLSRKVLWTNSFLGLLFLFQTVFFSSYSFTSTLQYVQIQTLVMTLIVSFGILKAFVKNRPGARMMALGYLCVAVTVLHDLFASHRVTYGLLLAPFGFFAFLVSQATILAKIFSNAFQTAEHLTQNLQSEVDSKTRELQNEDAQKTAFFASISHELRTPLTLILGPIESALIYGKDLTEKQLSVVYRNSKKLLSLVNQLLDLQKIAAGKFELQCRTVDFTRLLEEVLQNFSFLAERKNIKLEISPSSLQALVWADAVQLEKCISNYLSNALKFTPEGGQILMSMEKDPSGQKLLFQVRDNGKGIPLEKQTVLFKRFGYSDPTLTKEQEGTGLGLSLVREIIELHKGEVGFDSKEGQGSVFSFTIPLSQENEALEFLRPSLKPPNLLQDREERIPQDGPVFLDNLHTNATLLIVEDNPDLREFIIQILQKENYQVYQAFDGESGLKAILHYKPDLVITDLMMPKMTGADMILHYKKIREIKTIPSILLTAKADMETRKEVRLAGADAYLSKPFNEEELLAIVRNLVSLKRKEKYLLKEISKAKKIQDSLLPKSNADFPGLSYGFFLKSQDDVGGDFLDYLILDKEKIRFMIADVSGHGLPAAMLATTLKILFQKSKDLSISDFLREASSDLRTILAGNFITAQIIDIHLTNKTLEVGCAGHPGFFLIHGGEIYLHEIRGKALGVGKVASYETESLSLSSQDRIVLVTDGVIEFQIVENRIFGVPNLQNLLWQTKDQPISQALFSIQDTLESYALEKNFEDDATLLAIDIH